MKKGITLIALCLLASIGLQGDTQYRYIHSWDTDVYFGHVIYPEAKHDGKDAVVFREGSRRAEVADLNLPLSPGDTIKTGERRCEIQFDTGTIIRLDRDSEMKIETILARSLSSKNLLTNLLLKRGQAFIMYKKYIRKEVFQIITPNAAVKLDHGSVTMIDATPEGGSDILIKEGRAHMLYGAHENAIKTEVVKKSNMVTVTPGHKMIHRQYEPRDDFEEWNDKINKEFVDLHEGKAVVPLPIQRMPNAIFYFAQKYGSLYGEWLWDSYLGYVWRPFLNDHAYPGGGSWMPYHHGRWTSTQGQLFWVPYETWGWVPYHLGIWMWNKKKGWLWIPGSVFAPAWVDWTFCSGSFCWRPWSLLDWYSYYLYGDSCFLYSRAQNILYPDYAPPAEGVSPEGGTAPVRQVLSKDQLKSKKAAPYPMPEEVKEAYKRVVVALENREAWVISPLEEIPNHMLVVKDRDLNASRIHERAVTLSSLPEATGKVFLSQRTLNQNPIRMAEQAYHRNEKMVTLHGKIENLIQDLKGLKDLEVQEFQLSDVIAEPDSQRKIVMDKEGRSVELSGAQIEGSVRKETSDRKQLESPGRPSFGGVSSQPAKQAPALSRSSRSIPRFRDWNPDAKAARRAGISIQYSSRTNEVRCPELNISSRNVSRSSSTGIQGPRVRLTSQGSLTSTGSIGTVSSGGTSSSSSSARSSSSNSSNSGTGSKNASSSGAAKGKVKK